MEHISEGSVTHWSEFRGICDLAEKHVFSQERTMRMNFVKKWDWLVTSKIRPGMPIELSTFWYISLVPTRYRKSTGWRYGTSVNSGVFNSDLESNVTIYTLVFSITSEVMRIFQFNKIEVFMLL